MSPGLFGALVLAGLATWAASAAPARKSGRYQDDF